MGFPRHPALRGESLAARLRASSRPFKTATAEAAGNFIGSVFRDVGRPDMLVSDRDTGFTSAFWTGLQAAAPRRWAPRSSTGLLLAASSES